MNGRWRTCRTCRTAEHACPRVERDGAILLTLREAAHVLGVHWTRLYALVRTRRLAARRVPGHASVRYVTLAEIEAYRQQRDTWRSQRRPAIAAE